MMKPTLTLRRLALALGALGLLAVPAHALAQDDEDDEPAIELAPPDEDEPGEADEEPVIELAPEDESPGDDGDDGDDDRNTTRLGTIYITHTPEEMAVAGGSAQLVGEDELDQREEDDPHAALRGVTGLTVRTEDGYGLRPNIGLRGVNSERSKKVTLMEDGVLLAPAPYSAPAAYYFPLITRMTGIEVFKGPGAILFGPNTIGGAINLLTRDVPGDGHSGSLDVAAGTDLYGKAHTWYGYGDSMWGILVEGVHLRSGGFKDLDIRTDDTGFSRSEAMIKVRANTDPDDAFFHRLDLKLGYSNEHSNETYLGLSDDDLAATPHRRYVASALDEMDWNRFQLQSTYRFEWEDAFSLTATVYRHDFHRIWNKLNSFVGASISDVLSDPDSGQRRVYYDVLTGRADSASDDEQLLIGPNERTFVSQGIQLVNRLDIDGGELWGNELIVGLRLHYDSIERDHSESPYEMRSQRLVRAAGPRRQTALNTAWTLATAVWILNELRIWRFHIAPGIRVEAMEMHDEDDLTGTSGERSDEVFIPGIGVHYAITDELGALAGVHRGFSPVAPGQPDDVEPETSINYEAGLRYIDPARGAHFEAIGFFADYTNLTGQCTFSQGCSASQLDRQFNAGAVFVWGVEALARYRFVFFDDALAMPARLTYTYTGSSFQAAFVSDDPIYGSVEEGDELPYVPEHQLSVGLGAETEHYWTSLDFTWTSPMRETAGGADGDDEDDALLTDHQFMLDFVAGWRFFDWAELYLRVDNLIDTAPITSRRPFGARPPKPLGAQVGVELTF